MNDTRDFPEKQFPAARGKALVATVDATIRLGAFDRLAEAGWRVDAVGDAVSMERRLAKDRYDLIVTDTLEVPDVGEGTRVVVVDRATFDDRGRWEALIAGE